MYNAYSNEAVVMAANRNEIIRDDLFFAGLAAADPKPLMELWDERRWVNHQKKIPYNPRTGSKARSNDPNTCVYFKEAAAALNEFEGVEYLLGNGVCAIDLDHCINPETGKIDEEAYRIVDMLDSYAEVSPSGTGIHILIKGDMPFTGRQGSRDADLQIEMYSEFRFITITGDAINDKPIGERTAEIKGLADQYFPETEPHKKPASTSAPMDLDNKQKMVRSALNAIDPVDCDYLKWLRIGVGTLEAGCGPDVWDEWSSRDPDRYKPGECEKKWRSFKDKGQNGSGIGIIIELAKENGWEPGDAFDEDDKEEYFKSKALAELKQMSHLNQAIDADPVAKEVRDSNESNKKAAHSADTSNMRDRIISGAKLTQMDLKMPDYFVDKMLPEGATILAGPSKIGKSLLALDLANKVSQGDDFMGRPTKGATVLVYSLEDSWARLKDRLIKQGHVYTDPEKSPQFAITAPTYYDGLKDKIEEFIQENGRSLIILDTLQLISPPRTGKVNDYDYYYPFLSDISDVARTGHSSIVLIHHTTKTVYENNPFDRILGNTAIQGATDAMIVITCNNKQFKEHKATLHYRGRDVQLDEVEMVFNENNLTWSEAGSAADTSLRDYYDLDPVMITIRTIMEEM